MARPIKTGMTYFSHDTDAANDEKIEAMRNLFGNEGYAFYFLILEKIYQTADAKLDLSKKSNQLTIYSRLKMGKDRFDEMLQAAFDLELFSYEIFEKERKISSDSIQRRFEFVQSERDRCREKKKKKTTEKQNCSGVFPRENPGKTPQSKVNNSNSKVNENNSKVNENKVNNSGEENPQKTTTTFQPISESPDENETHEENYISQIADYYTHLTGRPMNHNDYVSVTGVLNSDLLPDFPVKVKIIKQCMSELCSKNGTKIHAFAYFSPKILDEFKSYGFKTRPKQKNGGEPNGGFRPVPEDFANDPYLQP